MQLSEQEDIKAIREGLLAWRETSESPEYEEGLLHALARIEYYLETLESGKVHFLRGGV